MTEILVTLSDLTIPLALRYPETARFFPAFDPAAPRAAIAPAYMSDPEWRDFLALGMADDAHSESNALTGKCSDALIPFDRAIFHAVALRWRGFAWLITATTGVGKSTQYRTLDALRPGEFTMICGDRPVLDFRGEQVVVWPSPWNGKECWSGAPASPLAGIIFLERGEKNRLAALSEREAILRAYPAWVYNALDAAAVEKVAAFETKLLSSVPLWLLTAATVPLTPSKAFPLRGRCPEGADEVDPQVRERSFDDTCKPADDALPDVSASTQLLLDSVFTEAILPRSGRACALHG